MVIRRRASSIVSCRWRASERAFLVLLPNEPLHRRVGFVDVKRHRRFDILRVVYFIRCHVSSALHILLSSQQWIPSLEPAPSRDHTSTCSVDQESMLSDLTLLMCVPIFRCRAAHRMHTKMPSYSRCSVSYIINARGLVGKVIAYTPARPS